MLPQDRRLRTERDWDTLFREGYGVSGQMISLRIRPTPGSRRLGVSVGRRIGGSVTRNRVKRQIRGLVARLWDSLPEADIAVLARPAVTAADAAALESALSALLVQARGRQGAGR